MAATASCWEGMESSKVRAGVIAAVAGLVAIAGAAVWSSGGDDGEVAGTSTTPETIADRAPVPDVVGLNGTAASQVLSAAGFELDAYGDETQPAVEQFPEAGDLLIYGREVVVRFSDPDLVDAPPVEAPDVGSTTTTSTPQFDGYIAVQDPETGEVVWVPDPDAGQVTPPTTQPLREGAATTVARGSGPGATVPIVAVDPADGDNDGIVPFDPGPGVLVDVLEARVQWDDPPVYETDLYTWVVYYAQNGVEGDRTEIATLPVTGASCETVRVPVESVPAIGRVWFELQLGGQPGDSYGGPASGPVGITIRQANYGLGPVLVIEEDRSPC